MSHTNNRAKKEPFIIRKQINEKEKEMKRFINEYIDVRNIGWKKRKVKHKPNKFIGSNPI